MVYQYAQRLRRFEEQSGRGLGDHRRIFEKEIRFEPDERQLLTALADIIVSNIKGVKDYDYKQELEIARQMIEDNDLQDFLAEKYKEELKDYFEEDAMEILR